MPYDTHNIKCQEPSPPITKHFYVYTIAGAAKFLRIYYARVKQYLNQMETASASVSPN